MPKPINWIYYGKSGTLQDFLMSPEDKDLYQDECKIIVDLLGGTPSDIISTSSDEDFTATELLEEHLDRFVFKEQTDNFTKLEKDGFFFVRTVVEGGLIVYYTRTFARTSFTKMLHHLSLLEPIVVETPRRLFS